MLKTKPPMYGADKEADKILARLPRASVREVNRVTHGPNAWAYLDAAGRLCVLIEGDGLLTISERNLAYVNGDEDPFMLD